MAHKKELSAEQRAELLLGLHSLLMKNRNRHNNLEWFVIQARLEADPGKMWTLSEMETTGGEPDVVTPLKVRIIFFSTIALRKVRLEGETFVTTVKGSRREKKTNQTIMPWIWQLRWALNF